MDKIKIDLAAKVNDEKLVENLFASFQKISEEYIAQKPVDLLQNTGLFLESVMRVTQHLIEGKHTPLGGKFDLDACVKSLESVTGSDRLRIHVSRLSRAVYDFRSRKKSVHLKDTDPQAIDADLVFNVCNWILIEVLKESGVTGAEQEIKILHTRKVPLVQSVGGILRTTNPKLSGTQRILMLLYSDPEGMSVDELLESTKIKIKNKNHLNKDLKNLETRDIVHLLPDGNWTLFGHGFNEAEAIISKFSSLNYKM